MPDGGNSWYVNWAESEEGTSNRWEDFIVRELVSHVDRLFRTIPVREGRAINGLSMGGFGALSLGLRHPEVFCSAASHSGALGYARSARKRLEAGEEPGRTNPSTVQDSERDADVPAEIRIEGFTHQSERTPDGVVFATAEQCDGYDPFALVEILPAGSLPHLYIDCGLQDGLIGESQEFARLLMEKGVPFTYAQGVGEHRPSYWRREVRRSMQEQFWVMMGLLGGVGQR